MHDVKVTFSTVFGSEDFLAEVRPRVEPLRSYFLCSRTSVGKTLPITTNLACTQPTQQKTEMLLQRCLDTISFYKITCNTVHPSSPTCVSSRYKSLGSGAEGLLNVTFPINNSLNDKDISPSVCPTDALNCVHYIALHSAAASSAWSQAKRRQNMTVQNIFIISRPPGLAL